MKEPRKTTSAAPDDHAHAAPTIDPADAALAAAAGVDLADLDDDDLAELRAQQADTMNEPPTLTTERPLVPEVNGTRSHVAISLFLEACERFGANPFGDVEPKEILSWRFYPGADEPGRVSPDAVVFVTAGGLKIKHYDDPAAPMEPETLDRLRRVFGCYQEDPHQPGKIIVLPLPADLHLPAVAVTGVSASTEHQYPGGYLQAGGREAADEKQRRREARQMRFAGPTQK